MYFLDHWLFQVKTKILSPFFLIFVKNLWRLNCTLNTLKTTYWFPVLSLQNKNGSFVQNYSQMHIFKRCCSFNKINAKLTLNLYLGLKKCLWLINYLKNCPPNDDVAYVSSFGSLILGNNNRNSPQYWAYPMYHQLNIAYFTFLPEPTNLTANEKEQCNDHNGWIN